MGGHFAWYVKTWLQSGMVVTGPVWHFSLLQSLTYATRVTGDTYIDHRPRNYASKRNIFLRSENTT
eukprot:CAMPEP_0168490934 /NCGR_PEP_ID=MMETSP0228-20121227/69441_1 /TAXON_ID=133427 /ORGANISM="Protoceratium reticulatum, Strain CCCM 535 (=CCMP 1889)" /LENGTH=65 /DNA_ID=CAMNT_0008507665 /DNA_START=16 /DNA_END=209 /DNA_ORIENTATION=+